MLNKLKVKIKQLLHTLKWLKVALKHKDKPLPIYAEKQSNGIKVHLGAGTLNIQGWINVDARDSDHIHLNATNFELNEFTNGSISKIYLCHVLEHFSFDESIKILKHFRKKLSPGGALIISVPDFNSLVNMYSYSNKDLNLIKKALMGGQDYAYNYHKSVYNQKLLTDLFTECGYQNIENWETEKEFGDELDDWSKAQVKVRDKSFPMSLNTKGINPGT